nr:DUF6192 family protein [Streptomyces durhamensis]
MRRDWSPVLARLRRRPRADLPLTERGRLLVEEYLQLRADQQAPDYRKNARPTFAAKVPEQEKVRVVEEFTRDELVATTAATSLLRRPDVAFRAMGDDTARHQVNHAQVERGRQAREHFEETSPVAPAIRNIDRSVEFLNLVTACHAFVAAAGRVVPGLRDRRLGDDERTIVHENVARVRATLDWIETAVDTGKVDVDGELAKLLQGE